MVGDGAPGGSYSRAPSEEVLRCGFTGGAQGAALPCASRARDAKAAAGSTARGVREGVGEPIQYGIGARTLPEGTQARYAPTQTLVICGFGQPPEGSLPTTAMGAREASPGVGASRANWAVQTSQKEAGRMKGHGKARCEDQEVPLRPARGQPTAASGSIQKPVVEPMRQSYQAQGAWQHHYHVDHPPPENKEQQEPGMEAMGKVH